MSFEVAIGVLCKGASDQGPEGGDDGFVSLAVGMAVAREVERSRMMWNSERKYFILNGAR